MYQYKIIGAVILSMLSVGIKCQSGEDRESSIPQRARVNYHGPTRGYFHTTSCDTETQIALDEVKSEIQNLQHVLVGLRQTVDPDFKLLPPPESRCPPGFQYVSLARSCYKVVYEEHNWTSADQRCHGLHSEAHLVAITKKDENNALKAYLEQEFAKNSHFNVCKVHSWGDPGKMLWTSGQRLDETSCTEPFVWKISNDTHLPLSFTYWSPKEPNCHANEESCLHIRQSHGFKWNDLACDMMLCPLCEYDPL